MPVKLSGIIRYNDEIYMFRQASQKPLVFGKYFLSIRDARVKHFAHASISVHRKCFHLKQGEYIF